MPLFDQLHSDWQEELKHLEKEIDRIDSLISRKEIAPSYPFVFRALSDSLDKTKVVIFGQDPYPTQGHANGLAFSVDASVRPLPPTLRNIYKELENDVGVIRVSGDLVEWREQGVMLINRILSTNVGVSKAHQHFGWQAITDEVAKVLGQRGVVAVLWGNSALELSEYFQKENVVSSVHPSPLSAYRGFFGSRPFSNVNSKLKAKGLTPISW